MQGEESMGNTFKNRLELNYNNLKWTYHALYNKYGATNKNFARLICILKEKYDLRSDTLKEKDTQSSNQLSTKKLIGMTLDTNALSNIEETIASLNDLGITYVQITSSTSDENIQMLVNEGIEVLVNYELSEELEKNDSILQKTDDLKNPDVFEKTVEVLLELANKSISMMNLDIASLYAKGLQKDEVHELLHMLHMDKDIVCQSVMLIGKKTSNMHDAIQYFGEENRVECELIPHQNYMSSIWNSLATRDVRVMRQEVCRYVLPQKTAWINCATKSNELSFTLSDDAIWSTGSNPKDHQNFLLDFYSGEFDGSFANGTRKLDNIEGSVADLVGVATNGCDEYAIKRDVLVHGLILTASGVPLICSGDEMALSKVNSQLTEVADAKFIYESIKQLIDIRKTISLFDQSASREVLMLDNNHVYAVKHTLNHESLYLLFNVTEQHQFINVNDIKLPQHYKVILNNDTSKIEENVIELQPYGMRFILSEHIE